MKKYLAEMLGTMVLVLWDAALLYLPEMKREQ